MCNVIAQADTMDNAATQTTQAPETVSAMPLTPANVYGEDKLNISVDSKHPTFTIQLKSNPTTGYSWFLREYDAKLLQPVKHNYKGGNTKLIGAGGFEYWTFRVSPAGFAVPQQTLIKFIYTRPWQSNADGRELVFQVSTQAK